MRAHLHWIALACGVIGAGVMVPFDSPGTRIVGIAFLAAFVVVGLFAIASPEYLVRSDDPEDGPRP